MTRQERAAVLEVARQICLERMEDASKRVADSRKYGHSSPGFNQDLGALDEARACAEAIEEAKEETT